MKFLQHLIPEKFRREKDPRPKLNTEEIWDFIYWSFFYSRGKQTVQEILFEIIIRNYQLPKKFNPGKVSQPTIQKTADFRNGARHQRTRDAYEEKTSEDMLLSSASELERIAGILKKTELKRGRFKKYSIPELEVGLAQSLLHIDYLYSKFNGSKISHIKQFFLSDSDTIPGGNIFSSIKSKLAKVWEKIFTSNEKVEMDFQVLNVIERETDNTLLNPSCREMWEQLKIQ